MIVRWDCAVQNIFSKKTHSIAQKHALHLYAISTSRHYLSEGHYYTMLQRKHSRAHKHVLYLWVFEFVPALRMVKDVTHKFYARRHGTTRALYIARYWVCLWVCALLLLVLSLQSWVNIKFVPALWTLDDSIAPHTLYFVSFAAFARIRVILCQPFFQCLLYDDVT